MAIKDCLNISVSALMAHRTRTLLASLGIVVGIASVIVMVAIGRGSQKEIMDIISLMGENLITVTAGEMKRRGGKLQLEGSVTNLSLGDAQLLLQEIPELEKAAPFEYQQIKVKFGNSVMDVMVSGSTPDFQDIRKYEISHGRFFNERDLRMSARVAVLGGATVKNIFGEEDPLGRTIRIGAVPVTVIGVFKSKGMNVDGQDQDDIAILPLTTMMRRVLNQKFVRTIYLKARSRKGMDLAVQKTRDTLRELHKLPEDKEDDFTLQSQLDLERAKMRSSEVFTALIVSVAAISLVVGGIGILAVMLISVKERTREIGLRRAVGASKRDIVRQFIMESSLIGFMGGTAGVIAGVAVTFGVNRWGASKLILNHESILVSTAVCVMVGIMFGVYPALKASRLDPVEALKVE
ncbi:MAG: ABC transporter permease [Nitrospinae bacterium]|nr:ABC transporter permease [Nitrospinota bacterium]